MKYKIPEAEKSKLRLFKVLSRDIRGAAAAIREGSINWEDAKSGITELIGDKITEHQKAITELRALRTLFNSTQSVGEQRENNIPVSPDRRRR